jgi:hypothetical protein
MRVLDVYPNYCWSFEADAPVTIRQLRAAAAIDHPGVRESELNRIRAGHAFRLVGDAAAFELAEDFFDEIQVTYAPSVLKRLILSQKLRRWLRPGGRLELPEPESVTVSREERYVPLRRPALAPA